MKAIPNELEYDVLQAKLCASLLWFVCRLSENGFQNIPQEVTSPIEVTTKNELLLRPAVIDYLSRGAMYLYIGSILYKQEFHNLWDLIQKMSHNGVFVMCKNDESVTDQDLMVKNPFNLSAHLALMDSLQIVYGNSIVTVPDVLNVIRSIGSFNAAKEMPFDVEDALMLWLSKVNEINVAEFKEEDAQDFAASSKVIMSNKSFPVVKNICESFRDTKTMLSLLLFYLPDSLKIESVKLASTLTVVEKINNIELFRCLCAEQVCTSVFALRMEDLLFAKEPLKTNFLVLLCEMFYKMEMERTDLRFSNYPSSEQLQLPQLTEKSDSSSAPHQHQQLLSKRSKRVFATLNSDSENSDVLLDDLEVKRSHVIPSTTNQHEFISVSQAWQGDSPTNEGRKPEKINLNFRHDYGSFSRATAGNSSDVERSEGYNVVDSVHASKSGMNLPSTHYEEVTSSHGIKNYNEDVCVSVHPYGGGRSSYEYLTVYPTDTQESEYQSFSGSSVSDSWQDTDHRNLTENYSLNTFNECPPTYQSNTQFSIYGKKQKLSPNYITEPPNRVTSTDIDEDALSTITEITEPDRISIYSLHSSSSSVATKGSNDDFDEDRKILDTTLKMDAERKIESIGVPSLLNQTRNPPDNVLLATISKTYKDTNKLVNTNTFECNRLQKQDMSTASENIRMQQPDMSTTFENNRIVKQDMSIPIDHDRLLQTDVPDTFENNRCSKQHLPIEVQHTRFCKQDVPIEGENNKVILQGMPLIASSTASPVRGTTTNTPVSPQKVIGSPETMRGSYTVKQGTRESALFSGHPIITDSMKQSYDQFNIRVRSDLAIQEGDAWYLTQSALPPSPSINNNNHAINDANDADDASDINANDISESSSLAHSIETTYNEENKAVMSYTEESVHDVINHKEESRSEIENYAQELSKLNLLNHTEESEDNMINNMEASKDMINQECYEDLLDIQENKFKITVTDPLTNLNGLNKLNTLWSTTEKMILQSMVKTSDNNMAFNKTFVSGEFVLKHLTTISNNNNFDDSRNNNFHNGIEKISFNSNKISPNGKIVEDDYTTWMGLFNTNNLGVDKMKIDIEKIKKNQEKLKRYKSSLTTWADLPQITLNGEDENEDETLSVQLAALRMQLEEKRRKFDEEKKRKQEQWREERAKNLQNAFFIMLNNEDQKPVDVSLASVESENWNESPCQPQHLNQNVCEEEVNLQSNIDNNRSFDKQEVKNRKIEKEILETTGSEECLSNEQTDSNEMKEILENKNLITNPNIPENDVCMKNAVIVTMQTNQHIDPVEEVIETTPMEIDEHPLSTLIQEFSPFSKPEFLPIKPVGYSTTDQISYVLNQLGNTDASQHTTINQQTPELSTVLNQLGNNNNTPQLLAAVEYNRNNFNRQNVTSVEDDKEISSFSTPLGTPTNTTYTLTESEHKKSNHMNTSNIVYSVMETVEKPNSLSYSEKTQVPNATIDSVLAQVTSSPIASLNYIDILPNEETPIVDDNMYRNIPQVIQPEEIPKFEQIVLQDEIPKFEDIVLQVEIPTEDENVSMNMTSNEEVLPFEQSVLMGSQTPHVNNTDNVYQAQNIIPEKVSDVLSQENIVKAPSAMAFSVGVDMMECPELTPQQIKKRERFLRQRQKNMEEEKERKAAELEKKQSMEESTPKKPLKEERPKEISHQEQQKDSSNLYQESLMKRLGNDQISQETPTTPTTPSRKGKRDVVTPRTPRNPQHTTSYTSSPADEASRYAEYTGPDAYKKPSGKSNRKIIQNAIMHCCLCGEVNKESKKKCLDAIEKSEANHFLVLFREGLKFRSVYGYHPENGMVTRVYGIGPKTINEKMMIKYYKYNSGGKEFYLLETKHLSIQVDGLMIRKELWEKKQANSSKTDSNLKKIIGNNQK